MTGHDSTRRDVDPVPTGFRARARGARVRDARRPSARQRRRRRQDEADRIGTEVHGQGDETRAERGDGGGPGR